MKKIFLLLISILFSITLVGCGIKEIDVSKYVYLTFDGADRLGKASAHFSYNFFDDYSISEDIAYNVSVIPSNGKNLKNGDEITVSLKYDEKLYKDNLKVKLYLSKNKYKVEGLEKKYLTSTDLSNDEYIKLKSETEKQAKEYMKSIKPMSFNYRNPKLEDFEFVNAYIKNPCDFSSESNDSISPSILYAFKVNLTYEEIVDFHLSNEEPSISNETEPFYIFVPVENLVLDKNGDLSKYKIPNYNSSYIIPCVDTNVPVEDALESFSSSLIAKKKDVFEKININLD